MFKILKKDKRTKARLGVLTTPHGEVKTPSYVIVATHAQIKCLKPSDIKKTKTQIVIANTYHLWDRALKIKNSKLKIHGILGTKIPVMTDSGGFQVFSLRYPEKRVGKILKSGSALKSKSDLFHDRIKNTNVKITNKGVYFSLDSQKRFFGPELSMKIQEKLEADILFAFDECTSPLDSFEYNKKALKRTHDWALRCLKISRSQASGRKQLLFGIVQGGRFKSLRIKSAKFIGSLSFDGFGIGGSFGKNEMVETLKWVVPHLPEEKPRHLLGIGRVKDIFNAIENGIDLFDCVIPTREARHGRIYTKYGTYDISKNHKLIKILDQSCKCPVCKTRLKRRELRAMFKGTEKEKQKAQRLATIHNIWFFNTLLSQIRTSIQRGSFLEFRDNFLRICKI